MILTTISGGSVFAAKRDNGQSYQQVLQAQLQSAESEKRLASQMCLVARLINRYRLDTGHFPEEGAESERLLHRLSAAAGANAYQSTDKQSREATPAAAVANAEVLLQVDLALSPLQISDIRKAPERFCKRAKPGTIIVLHNTEDYFLVWGAGIDGKPIAGSDGQERLLITSASMEENGHDANAKASLSEEGDRNEKSNLPQ